MATRCSGRTRRHATQLNCEARRTSACTLWAGWTMTAATGHRAAPQWTEWDLSSGDDVMPGRLPPLHLLQAQVALTRIAYDSCCDVLLFRLLTVAVE